jgi:hypothetical protein
MSILTMAMEEKSITSITFDVIADLGDIVVPAGYSHPTWLRTFKQAHFKDIPIYNHEIRDEYFSHPGWLLMPGDVLNVKVILGQGEQPITSEDYIDFLVGQRSVFPGAQGVALVWEQKRDKLPRGKWCLSLDKKTNLSVNMKKKWHRMTRISADSFCLAAFEGEWDEQFPALCFTEVPRQVEHHRTK